MKADDGEPGLEELHGAAEGAMFDGRFDEAVALYNCALQLAPEEQQLWLRLALGEAWFRQHAWAAALVVYIAAYRADPDAVVGNPLFHLRVGQCMFETSPATRGDVGPKTALDNLARALIGGGIELFDGERTEHLAAVVQVLHPPDDALTWLSTRGRGGMTRNRLDGARAHEFLWDMLVRRGVVGT